jgi:isochorismate synthase
MTDTKDLALFIDKLIAESYSFAIWSMPGSNTPEILIAKNEELLYPEQFNKLNGQEGFVFAPYEISETSPLVLLKPGIIKKGVKEILQIKLDSDTENKHPETSASKHYIIPMQQYLEDIEKTIGEIKQTKLAKVIVSRLIPLERKK